MREMKYSGIGWVSDIPSNWEVKRSKYCFNHTKQIAGSNADDYERLALTMNGVIKRSKDDNNGLQPEKFETYQVLKTDQLVFKLIDLQNISTSRVGLSPYLGLVSPAYIVLNANKSKVCPKFAEQYFLMLWRNQVFNALGDAGVRSSLNATELLELPIALPPLSEQKRIADFLDGKCGEIDGLVADIQSQIDTLEQYKRSVITETVTKGLNPNAEMKDSEIEWVGMIPNNWNTSKIKYIAEFAPHCGVEQLKPDSVVGYAPMECIKRGYFIERTAVYNTIPNSLTPFENGDIVMAKVTPCFENGNIAIMENLQSGIGFGSSELFVLRPKTINTKYLFYWLQNDGFIKKAASTMTGMGGLKRVSPKFVQDSFICIPTVAEQKRIADYLDGKCTEIDTIIDQKKEQLSTLESYKKSLIYEYVTGKKEVPV